MEPAAIASLLKEKAKDTAVDDYHFVVVDARSASDSSVVLVEADGEKIETVRIGFEQANGLTAAIDIGARGMEEPQDCVGADGVYRGDPSLPPSGPQKGGPAPRKQLS